jgi:hypothetical protein
MSARDGIRRHSVVGSERLMVDGEKLAWRACDGRRSISS